MMLTRKAWRTIRERKSQYFGAIVLILISCMLFGMFLTAGWNARDNLNQFRRSHQVEDAHFAVQTPLRDASGLEQRFGVRLEERQYADDAFDEHSVLRFMSAPERINLTAVSQGHPLQNSGDLLLDPGFAAAHHLSIGDAIEAFGRTFTISGFMYEPDYIYPLKSEDDVLKNSKAFGIAVISREDMRPIAQSTFYSIRLNGHSAAAFKAFVNDSSTIVQWVDKADNNRISFVDGDVQGSIVIGKILPVALLLLTMVMVAILIWRLLKQEYREIGTLYALGFRKGEIMRHYLLYPIVICLLGGPLGVACGLLGVRPLLGLYASYYHFPIDHIDLHWGMQLAALVLPFLFLLPLAAYVVWRVLRLPPLRLMRGSVEGPAGGGLEKRLNLQRLPFGVKFRIRELARNMPRTLLTILGAAFASMLFLLGFVTKDSMDQLVTGSYQNTLRYEYQYIYRTIQTTPPATGERMSFASFTSPGYRGGSKSFAIYGVQSDAKLILLEDSSGRPLDLNQVILTKPLAEKLDVAPGDEIAVSNAWSARSFRLTVGQIADTYAGDSIYMPLSEFDRENGFPAGSYLQVVSDRPLDIDRSELLSQMSKQDLLKGYRDLIRPLEEMIGLIAAVAFVIGLIVVHVVFTMTIEENRGQISLLKILGYRRKEVFSLVLGANKWLVLLGYLLAIPLILFSLKQMFNAITAEMDLTFPVVVKPLDLLIALALLGIVYYCSKWLNRHKIHRIPMDETLKSMNE